MTTTNPYTPVLLQLATVIGELVEALPVHHNTRERGHSQMDCVRCGFFNDRKFFAALGGRPEVHNPVLLRRAIRVVDRLVAFASTQPMATDAVLVAIGKATLAQSKGYELMRNLKGDALIGTRIIDVRNIDRSVVHKLSWYEAWHDVPLVLELDNELRIIPSRDHALNGPGVFTVIDERQQVFTLTSVTPDRDEH